MKILHALSLSVALLVAAWVYISIGLPQFKFIPWIGFVAWAAFYAAGGGSAGITKPVATSLAGVVLTALTMYCVGLAGDGLVALMFIIAVLAFVLVEISSIGLFSYTPAAFLGAASYFGYLMLPGSKLDVDGIFFVAISWIAGLLLGYASEFLGKKMASSE